MKSQKLTKTKTKDQGEQLEEFDKNFLLLDTHVLSWLYIGEMNRFKPGATKEVESRQLMCSPISSMELDYLEEIGRTKYGGKEIIETLVHTMGLIIDLSSLWQITQEAKTIPWTRDPFDRLLVAHSSALEVPLLTADRKILEKYSGAIPM